jgi:uncharacterized membrane protein
MQKTFQAMSSYSAIAAGIVALAYAYFFVVAQSVAMYSLSLMILGLLSIDVMVALYSRLKHVDEDMARLAMLLGVLAGFGMAVHGGYDLANAINPPAVLNTDLPSQIDPRGLVTFGLGGIALLKFSWLMTKDRQFPGTFLWVGMLSGVLSIVIYLARLTVLSPTNPMLLVPVLVNGFFLSPIWYIWLGKLLKK